MQEQVILREYQETDRAAIENIIRKTWQYDRFCSPNTAAKMARVYLNNCLTNQTFTRVAVVGHAPVGIIMGKNIQTHTCPLNLRIKWLSSIFSLFCSKEGRNISNMFGNVDGIDKELLSACNKDYKGELAFFVIDEICRGQGLGKTLFQSLVDYMKSQDIPEFYLFTDTSCNYPFYEHLGLIRRGEKQQTIRISEETGNMTFFIYDYSC